ncbi:unnamed protein product [Moneuplotes crassus]|uniref:Uncharacterized protein n=1 Tax=Euplotes crassus TaxID=5936 RepID=A0AAD1UNE6_EUPCR|nr:unnamed protein product [Moneuplotes crassus]
MSVNCASCKKISTQYCCDHKKAICGWCRSDQHFKCKVQMIVDVKEIEYQSMSLDKLIRTTETQCKQFDLEDDFPKFREAIDGIKKEFEEVKEEISKAMRYKEFLKFEEYQAKLDQIKTKISEDPNIKEVMSCCFMQIGLKQMQIEVLNHEESPVEDTLKVKVKEDKKEVFYVDPKNDHKTDEEKKDTSKKHFLFQSKGILESKQKSIFSKNPDKEKLVNLFDKKLEAPANEIQKPQSDSKIFTLETDPNIAKSTKNSPTTTQKQPNTELFS